MVLDDYYVCPLLIVSLLIVRLRHVMIVAAVGASAGEPIENPHSFYLEHTLLAAPFHIAETGMPLRHPSSRE
jgi:hypothetical protein